MVETCRTPRLTSLLLLRSGAMRKRRGFDLVDNALSPAARTHSEHDRRRVTCTDDHMRCSSRAMEEVPLPELSLLALHDQKALTCEYQEGLLVVLAVVHPHRLARVQDVEVDAKLLERSLALEVASRAKRPVITPTSLSRVEHEPAVVTGDDAELRCAQRRLARGHPEEVTSGHSGKRAKSCGTYNRPVRVKPEWLGRGFRNVPPSSPLGRR
jgi:hypothetical protein